MAKDFKLDSRDARDKLGVSPEPYYRMIKNGLYLGYRRGAKTSAWVCRRTVVKTDPAGKQTKRYVVKNLAKTDDNEVADGIEYLDFSQAVQAAFAREQEAREIEHAAAEAERQSIMGPIPTVRSAILEYLTMREAREQKSGAALKRDARSRLTRTVLGDPDRKIPGAPELADKPLHQLVANDLSKWRSQLPDDMAEASRRRTTNDLKAALNRGSERHSSQLPATLSVEIKRGLAAKERQASVAREIEGLLEADVRRIIEAAKEIDSEQEWGGDLLRMVATLAYTGSRFSQVARLKVSHVQVPRLRLLVPTSRKGGGEKQVKETPVPVDQDLIDLLRPAIAGRRGDEILLLRPKWEQTAVATWRQTGRQPWRSASELTRAWKLIVERAGFSASLVPYELRNASIIRQLSRNLPPQLVAALHDTSPTVINANYARFIFTVLDEQAAQAVPSLLPKAPAVLREVK